MVEKTYSELSDENLISVYPYSCAIETKTTTCEAVVQIQNVINMFKVQQVIIVLMLDIL